MPDGLLRTLIDVIFMFNPMRFRFFWFLIRVLVAVHFQFYSTDLSLGYGIDVIRISGTSLDCSELGPLHAYDGISQYCIQIVVFVIEFSDFVERCTMFSDDFCFRALLLRFLGLG